MFKKLLTAVLITSMLILPVSSVGPTSQEGASLLEQDYLPGDLPAQTGAAESMGPVIHAMLLVMLNQERDSFESSDSGLVWEGLYNMLSLYGQMDSRCDEKNGELFLPEETVRDYAAALNADFDALDELPEGLRDRMNYDNVSRCYLLVCGEGGLVRLQIESLRTEGTVLLLSGALMDEAEEEVLAQFRAVLQPRDNMFGYAVSALSITG